MAHKKKKQDKLIAGFLAFLTAFSPVASVVPVYAADLNGNDASSSVTMDPDSIQIDETGSGGMVLDGSDEGSDGITVVGDNDNNNNGESGGDSIVIEGNDDGIQIDGTDNNGDGIDIGDSEPDDGIQVDKPEPDDSGDGIDIDEPDGDGDGIDIGDTEPDDGIDIEYDDDGTIILDSINPWDGISEADIDKAFTEHSDETVDAPAICELDIDIRNVHGFVRLSPVDSDNLSDQRIVRVSYSDDEKDYITTVTDGNDKQVYQDTVSDIGGIAWSEFVASDL